MLPIIAQEVLTMSSREIAQLTNKQHSKVVRVIEDLIQKGVAKSATPLVYKNTQNGQMYNEFNLDKRDSLVLVARLSPEFTAAIVDRWQELEEQQTPKMLTQEEQLLALAQGVIKLTAERDQALATKAQINDKRTATLMNKASQDSKRIKALENQLQDQGKYLSVVAAKLPQRVDTEMRLNVQSWRLLKQISETLNYKTIKCFDANYGNVNAYHVDVIEEFKRVYM